MKSDSAALKRPSRFSSCWRSVWKVAIFLLAAVVGIDGDIVAVGIGRPEADGGAGREPFLLDDEIEHLARVVIERARDFADLGIVEDGRETPGQFPGLEERRPVDVFGELREVVGVKTPDAEKRRLLRRRLGEVGLDRVGAGIRQLQPLLVGLRAEMRRGNFGVFGADVGGIGLAPLGREQRRRHADGAAGVVDMHHRAALVVRVDLDGGMDAAGGGAADQQRHLHALPLHFAGQKTHLVERGRDQAGQPDDVGAFGLGGLDDLGGGHHDAEVDHLEIVTLQHDADDVLADVVDVALDGGEHDLAGGVAAVAGRRHWRGCAPSPLP